MDFSKLPSILTPDLGLLFWMLLAFLVVFFVLAKYGFPAIVNMEQAQVLKEAADTREAIINQAQEKAKSEGARLLAEAKAEIEGEKQQAIRDIRAQVAELSVQIAEKVLREKLSSDAEQMQMIDRLLDDVTAAK